MSRTNQNFVDSKQPPYWYVTIPGRLFFCAPAWQARAKGWNGENVDGNPLQIGARRGERPVSGRGSGRTRNDSATVCGLYLARNPGTDLTAGRQLGGVFIPGAVTPQPGPDRLIGTL